jgi:hypothetical protein
MKNLIKELWDLADHDAFIKLLYLTNIQYPKTSIIYKLPTARIVEVIGQTLRNLINEIY